MIKYDDIISTLTLVNILAKDVDYGNQQSIKEKCNLQQIKGESKLQLSLGFIFKNYEFVSNKFCDLLCEKEFCKKIFLKMKMLFLQFKFLVGKFKNFVLKYFIMFVNLYKNLMIFLQKIVLYNQIVKQEYG